MPQHKVQMDLGGRTLEIEMGHVARQADGAVWVRYGDTIVLVTACMDRKPREGADFLPLTCDYRENTYAAGKIPGGFFKREGRPNEKEILTSRLIDRPLRPLFPEGYTHETQIVALVLSADLVNEPDVLCVTGASTALTCSRVPFTTPIGCVRVGLLESGYVVNPTPEQLLESRLDLVLAGSEDAIVMVESSALEASEEEMVGALEFGHAEAKRLVALQKELAALVRPEKFPHTPPVIPPALYTEAEAKVRGPLEDALGTKGKIAYYRKKDQIRDALLSSIPEEDEEKRKQAEHAFEDVLYRIVRHQILEERRRTDGRRFDEIRPITCEVGILPRTHGSALFTRGETQALVTTTLGTASDAQMLDYIEGESFKRFMVHYNFPPFSVGEVKFLRGPGRREIGHGILAERALRSMLPGEDQFPYTLRLVSDIFESNGSSSMASVCGGSLALMDAGVPLRSPVAGIAMGLVKEGDRYAVLTDIAGEEDHLGDMDFKVAGTSQGITALQMDIKIGGLTRAIMAEALDQARRARLEILETMNAAIGAPRADISAYAPRIVQITIPKDKIGAVIGPGGKMIRSIIEETDTKIEVEDDGTVTIAGVGEEGTKRAREIIEGLTATAEIGKVYKGKVVRIMDYGAFVQILPGVDGLLHVSEISHNRVTNVRDVLQEDQEIEVKLVEIDHLDRLRLSRKVLEEAPEGGGDQGPSERRGPDRDRPRRREGEGGGGGRRHGGPRRHGGGGGGGRHDR